MFGVIGEGQDASVQFFNHWVEDVERYVPAENLLVFSVKEGWHPLCKFLNVPEPDQPFPMTNDSKSMSDRVQKIKIGAYILFGFFVFIALSVLGIVIFYLFGDNIETEF